MSTLALASIKARLARKSRHEAVSGLIIAIPALVRDSKICHMRHPRRIITSSSAPMYLAKPILDGALQLTARHGPRRFLMKAKVLLFFSLYWDR